MRSGSHASSRACLIESNGSYVSTRRINVLSKTLTNVCLFAYRNNSPHSILLIWLCNVEEQQSASLLATFKVFKSSDRKT